MCCNVESWSAKANNAKCLAVSVLVFGIFDLLSFFVGGVVSGVAAIIAIIGSGLIICCGPPAPGPGRGCSFKATAILALIAAIVHLIGIILLIGVVTAVGNGISDACLENACSGTSWRVATCGVPPCASERACRTDEESSARAVCAGTGTAVAGHVTWLERSPGISVHVFGGEFDAQTYSKAHM